MHKYWQQQLDGARLTLITGAILMLANLYFHADWLELLSVSFVAGGLAAYGPARSGQKQAAQLELTRIMLRTTLKAARRYRNR